MKTDVVVYGQHGRHVLGQVDVYADSWLELPANVQFDVDLGILTGELELVLHRKREDAIAKHYLVTRKDVEAPHYKFQCLWCAKTINISKHRVRELLLNEHPERGPLNFPYIAGVLGTCVKLSDRRASDTPG